MNSFFQTLAFIYLLYPILGLLLVGLGIFIAKKNALLGNKRLVGYTVARTAKQGWRKRHPYQPARDRTHRSAAEILRCGHRFGYPHPI